MSNNKSGRKQGGSNSNFITVDKWLTEDGLFLIECWARDGYTNEEIYKRMGISMVTFRNWRIKHPQIEKALSKGKEVVDYMVENALLKNALGYTTKETKIFTSAPDKNGNRRTRTETLIKENAPDTIAAIMWLNNRKPDMWKRNRDQFQELTPDGSNITVNIIKSSDVEKINKVVKAVETIDPNNYEDSEEW